MSLLVRAPLPGDGVALSRLWKELWDAHEAWGGYPGAKDLRVYDEVAERIEGDAYIRGGQPSLGRHVHLVAVKDETVVGQVEGWLERYGHLATTPVTCEVRSLVVHSKARGAGIGRALLEALASTAAQFGRGSPIVLAAEVLEANPARTFYERAFYSTVAWTARMSTQLGPLSSVEWRARKAIVDDALALARCEGILADRRRERGDRRFDPPRALEASFVESIARYLRDKRPDASEWVIERRGRGVVGSATLVLSRLDPPFLAGYRATLARVVLEPESTEPDALATLVVAAAREAACRGARTMEIADLPGPHSSLQDAAIALGADPWSRVMSRVVE